jgi:hypothetical protein
VDFSDDPAFVGCLGLEALGKVAKTSDTAFTISNIKLEVLAALVTRSGGEILYSDDY